MTLGDHLRTQLLGAIIRIITTALFFVVACSTAEAQTLFPANQALSVNVGVQLKVTFNQQPTIGKSGNPEFVLDGWKPQLEKKF